MTARTILAAVAVLVAAAMTTTALAASTAKDPRTLVLQKADFPAGAKPTMKPIRDKTPQVDSYSVGYRFKSGSKRLDVLSVASVMSVRDAKTAFRQAHSLFRNGYRPISLPKPKYGEEQTAALAREDNEGNLWVRTGGTVWAISVNTADLDSGFITKPEAIAQLKLYGRKAMERVGSG